MDDTKKINILISAYECSPNHGSEAGLGWNWIMSAVGNERIAKVFVITMERYHTDIEKYIEFHKTEMTKVEFLFVPLPLGKFKRLNQRFKYIIWQRQIVSYAERICSDNDISFIHHVTWATCVFPPHLYKVGVPFLYGPVGGGERIPSVVDLQMNAHDRLAETIRKILADVSMSFPSTRRAFRESEIIFSTTEETEQLIPAKFRSKVCLMQSIGIQESGTARAYTENEHGFSVLLAARMLYWKGIDIAIEVFRRLKEQDSSISLKVVGGGTCKRVKRYQSIIKECPNIVYLGNVSFDEMKKLYNEADILLNCSLHDSGCMVILEAMSVGLPVIAIDTGGPHILIDDESCVRITPDRVDIMVDQICYEIIRLKNDPRQMKKMSENAIKRANTFKYSDKYDKLIDSFENCKNLNWLEEQN